MSATKKSVPSITIGKLRGVVTALGVNPYEFEFRFKITPEQFSRLELNVTFDSFDIYTSEIFDNNIRRQNNKVEVKELVNRYSIDGILFVISSEKNIKVDLSNKTPKFVRTIRRHTKLQDGVRIDVSNVESDGKVSYELEIDFSDSTLLYKAYDIAKEYYRIATGSQFYYSPIELDSIMKVAEIRPNKPIDIRYRDITYDNIMGNKYKITIKANGVRALLISESRGIYLLLGNMLNKISSDVSFVFKFTKDTGEERATTRPTIFDAELMDNVVYLFDTIMVGGVNITDKPLVERLSYVSEMGRMKAQSLSDIISTASRTVYEPIIIPSRDTEYKIEIKPYYDLDTPDEFFDAIRKLALTTIDNDGNIFTSGGSYYDTVYKQKPVEKLTIDLLVIDGVAYTSRGRDNIRFNEVAYTSGVSGIWEFELRDEMWFPIRERFDKMRPNKDTTVNAILALHRDPVTYNAIAGYDLTLMRKYHNREKTDIYDYLYKQGVVNILDFGSGRGGDVAKWAKNAFRVMGVEPDPENRVELYRRLNVIYDGDYSKSIQIVEEKAQDITSVSGFVPEAITMFNSITFFQGDDLARLLNLVSNTLRINGLFVIVGIDSSLLLKNFTLPYSDEDDTIQIRRVSDTQINVNLSDTIVRDQTEYLVNFRDLYNTIKQYGFIMDRNYIWDKEKLMPIPHYLYSSSTRVLILRKIK